MHTFTHKFRDLCWYDYHWRTEWAPTLDKWILEKEYVRHTGRSKLLRA